MIRKLMLRGLMINKIAWVLLISLALASCNKKSTNTDPIDNTREALKDANLQEKTFRGDCQEKPINEIVTGLLTLGESSLKSQRIQYRFAGANVSRVTHLYSSRDCSGSESFTFEESGELRIQDGTKTPDGSTFVEFDYQKLELKMSSQEGVVIANAANVCGMNDWSLNNSRDVITKSENINCYNLRVPRQEYNVYRIDSGNTLFFGTHAQVNTPESRPTSVKTDLKYISE
ncbi:MAG: hypothetical protein J0M15_09185 [Deltaproteobacteria bacterium]|jgi:hypothetical protein|nr:hypothetical protein [Deltaproteobacteria bacterium]